ncbi:MAG: redoxin domain-containing protein [Chloroflexi bacterium]|jgi:thioredoxin-dependent peroxiredoxin|nr:redoxin domain-containing protein [Chloroflexota bacterium]
MNTKPQLLTPGEPAPDFELTDVNGSPIRLSSYRGQKPVVLAFLRGFM